MQFAGTVVTVHYAKGIYLNKSRKLGIGIVESNQKFVNGQAEARVRN